MTWKCYAVYVVIDFLCYHLQNQLMAHRKNRDLYIIFQEAVPLVKEK